jgi:putative hydrolase of the HAD superfamily
MGRPLPVRATHASPALACAAIRYVDHRSGEDRTKLMPAPSTSTPAVDQSAQVATPDQDGLVRADGRLPEGPIRLVTFDLYDTLIELVPPRWERMAKALGRVGIAADVERLRAADRVAEDYYTLENGGIPIRDRSREDREAFRLRYTATWLKAAGLPHDPDTAGAVRRQYVAEFETGPGWGTYRVFPDVLPALVRLREASIKRAMISNADADVTEFVTHLEVAHEFDAIVTSAVVGYEKPDPRTFHAALDHPAIRVPAEAALHVGDQPRSDIAGALGVGMRAALLDRYGRQPEDLPAGEPDLRVASLLDLVELVVRHNARR